MYRATTPLQVFTFPVEVENFSEIVISYSQRKLEVLKKTLADLTIDEKDEFTAYFTMTQEESKKFIANVPVYVQVRAVGATGGEVIASTIVQVPCDRVLDDTILVTSNSNDDL